MVKITVFLRDSHCFILIFLQQLKEMNEKNQNLEHCLQMLKLDVSSKEKEAMKSKELLKEHQTSELYQKNEVRKYLNTAREGMERERQDRYLLLVEQNKLKHKVEKLSENCKSYQVKLYLGQSIPGWTK